VKRFPEVANDAPKTLGTLMTSNMVLVEQRTVIDSTLSRMDRSLKTASPAHS